MTLYLPNDFHVGRASELKGKDRVLYRFLEIFPGLLSWVTLIGVVLLSFFAPAAAAYLIIGFSLFWLLKTIYLSAHVRYNWKRLRHNMKTDWSDAVKNLKHDHLWHLILLPYYNESYETVRNTVEKLTETNGNKKKMIVVLAPEERGGEDAIETASKVIEEFKGIFGHSFIAIHPKDLPGEMAGKGSIIAYAAEITRTEILDKENIPYEDVIVSAFDVVLLVLVCVL